MGTLTRFLLLVNSHIVFRGVLLMAKLEEVLNWPSVAELCRRTGVCQNTAYNWLWTRKVEAIQVLGSWRINPKDIERIRIQRAERAAKKARMGNGHE